MTRPCNCLACGHEWTATEGTPCPVCRIADAAPEEAVISPVGLGIWILALGAILALVVAL